MALQTARPHLGPWGTRAPGSLLLLLLSLGWVPPSRAQAADTGLHASKDLRWQRPERTVILPRAPRGMGARPVVTAQEGGRRCPAVLTAVRPRIPERRWEEEEDDGKIQPPPLARPPEQACPPGRKAQAVDENLVFYEDWELEACVDGALLADQMARLSLVPFTYEQLHIFKLKLDELYPQGYPPSLVRRLSYFFLSVTPEDVLKWNVTSLETVKSLLKVSKGRGMDAQVAALIARYVRGGGRLDNATLDTLATFQPMYLCFLCPEQLGSVQLSVVRVTRPQDLDACSPRQMAVLYPKARTAFQNMSGSEYFARIKPYLRGAPTEDLRALSRQNISLDMAMFKKLQTEVVLKLTVAEVQKLLGSDLVGLKAEEENSPLREWISRQPQDELDRLGLGLRGGVPNGYLVLDLSVREATSGGPHLLRPGLAPVLTVTPSLLLGLIQK